MSTSPVSKLKSDLSSDEQALIAELRLLSGNVAMDAAQLVADSKAAGTALYTKLNAVLKNT